MNAQKSKPEKKSKTAMLAEGMALPKLSPKADVPEELAKPFEGNGSGGSEQKSKGKPRGGRSRRNLPVENAERLSIYAPIDLMTKVRMHCAVERLSISEAVSNALAAWIAGVERGGSK